MDELERRLGRVGGAARPGQQATDRARTAVMAERPRRTRMGADAALPGGGRRVAGRLATAGLVAAAVVVAAVAIVAGPHSGPSATPTPQLPTEVHRCTTQDDGASIIGCVVGAAERRLATPELRKAPWLYLRPPFGQGRMATEPERPSLRFPPGVGYPQALSELYSWVALVGTLPPGARVEAPLPDGVVLLRPADATEGIAIDLRAPWGWEPSEGRILSPSLTIDQGLTMTSRPGELWARGARVDVPRLLTCQVLERRDAARTPCGAATVSFPAAPALPVVRVDEPSITSPKIGYVDGPRCRFDRSAGGLGRAVIVEGDFVNLGTAGTATFTGSFTPVGSDREVTQTLSRAVVAGDATIAVTVRVPLQPGDRLHLVQGRPNCGIDGSP